MKKNFLYLFTVLCTLSFFTACSDDDDPKDPNVLDVNTAYSGDKLDLKYSGSALPGKEITFDTKDGKTATITMKGTLDIEAIKALFSKSQATLSIAPGVIPGEVTTTISNVALALNGEKYTFEGTDKNNGREIKYTGEVEKDKLTMSLDVAMPDNALVGTWNLAPFISGGAEANSSQPIYSVWESGVPFKIDISGTGTPTDFKPGDLLALATSIMPIAAGKNAHQLLLSVLQSVTFNKDGNIAASFSKGSNISDPQWTDSPVNIAQYYVKDGMVYLLLNPDMIIAGMTKASKPVLSNEVIFKLMTEFLPMLSTGIPLAYKQDGGKLAVFSNTELTMKLLAVALPLLQDEELLKKIMASVGSNESFKPYAGMVKGILEQLPAVVGATTKIELGINLTKK